MVIAIAMKISDHAALKKSYLLYVCFTYSAWTFRAGKIRFSGAWKSVLIKASSGECFAPQNFVHFATFQGTRVHLIMYLVEQ